MRNICARFAQDCTYFRNAQYMHKICTRLYLFLQCATYVQGLHKIVLISPMRNKCTRFVQDSLPMRNICARLYFFPQCIIYVQDCTNFSNGNICTRFAQDCTYFSNAQYMCKICARLYFFPQRAIYVQDLHRIVLNF